MLARNFYVLAEAQNVTGVGAPSEIAISGTPKTSKKRWTADNTLMEFRLQLEA